MSKRKYIKPTRRNPHHESANRRKAGAIEDRRTRRTRTRGEQERTALAEAHWFDDNNDEHGWYQEHRDQEARDTQEEEQQS
jgi:hypothetical protein